MSYTDKNLRELKEFFKTSELKLQSPVKLYPGTTILNIPAFIESHFEVLEAAEGKPLYDPFYERLLRLKQILLEGEKS